MSQAKHHIQYEQSQRQRQQQLQLTIPLKPRIKTENNANRIIANDNQNQSKSTASTMIKRVQTFGKMEEKRISNSSRKESTPLYSGVYKNQYTSISEDIQPRNSASINDVRKQSVSINKNSNKGNYKSENQKDQILRKLKQKNQLLRKQIISIQKLQQAEKRRKSQPHRDKSFETVLYAYSTKQSLIQQLANAYDKIRRMEAQIKQIKQTGARNANLPKKVSFLKERVEQMDRIKQQKSTVLQKIKRDNKKLEQCLDTHKNGKGYHQTIKQLLQQIEQLKQKQKDMRDGEQKKRQKLAKQQKYILKVQKELIENGVSREFVKEMMDRIMYGDNAKNKAQKADKQQNAKKMEKVSVQQMTKQHNKFKHEMEVLQKSIKEQEKIIIDCADEHKSITMRLQSNRKLCSQLDEEISQVELSITQMRKSINPINMKPRPLPPKQVTFEQQKKKQQEHLKEVRKKFYDRKTRKYLKSIIQSVDQQPNEFNNQKQSNRYGYEDEGSPSKLIIVGQQEKQRYGKDKEQNKEMKDQDKEIEDQQRNEQEAEPQNKQMQPNLTVIFGKQQQNAKFFTDEYLCEQLYTQPCKLTGLSVKIKSNRIYGIKTKYNHELESCWHEPNQRQQTIAHEDGILDDKNYVVPKLQQIEVQKFECVQNQHIDQIYIEFKDESRLVSIKVHTNMNRSFKFEHENDDEDREKLNKQKRKEFIIPGSDCSQIAFIIGSLGQEGVCQLGARLCLKYQQISGLQQQKLTESVY